MSGFTSHFEGYPVNLDLGHNFRIAEIYVCL